MTVHEHETDPPAFGYGRPYTALAQVYDRIMSHVDYKYWASYLLTLIDRFAPCPRDVLELGCGTGNITRPLSRSLKVPYLATDGSPEMLAVARTKLPAGRSKVCFQRLDFRLLEVDGVFDVIILAYDGINYVLETDMIADLFERVQGHLRPGGIFLFDQSTPANSINNLAYFDDAWEKGDEAYSRTSEYDPDKRLHVTRFDIRVGGKRTREIHFQRAYSLEEMEKTLKLSSLRVEDCFDAFTEKPATSDSERIQWVLSGPQPTD